MAEMTKLRVNEAIARAQTAGIKVYKKEVAARLWEGRTESAQQVNMTNLCKRKFNPVFFRRPFGFPGGVQGY